ncbi:MAG TPA: protein translocase subunit SecD, partial [Candidatus Nanoarchaeia archaeon]|nr:protein translocase subunit SecD [Candidatus Nanoarchaeia archaeon]
MNKSRIFSLIIIVVAVLLGFGLYISQAKPDSWLGKFPFVLGLDLNGGTELVYRADVSRVAPEDITGSMNTLRDVIERRVNIFGVSEPIVQTEKASALAGDNEYRLIVELPGVTEIDKAIELIGQTPLLEFKLIEQKPASVNLTTSTGANVVTNSSTTLPSFVDTDLTGRFLERATVEFNPNTNQPIVTLKFNSEGAEIFTKLTRDNIGKPLAIFLDGEVISSPVIREEIPGGQAVINGDFSAQEARFLVRNLNYGALPVPIELVGTQTIGPSLGAVALKAGVHAGIVGFILVVLFLILWYRLPGVIASAALVIYILLS